jgi:hypothetical protein
LRFKNSIARLIPDGPLDFAEKRVMLLDRDSSCRVMGFGNVRSAS